jgi:hypothetical protein
MALLDFLYIRINCCFHFDIIFLCFLAYVIRFMTFAHTLHGIRQKILDMKLPPASVEVEFRIGMLVLGQRRWLSGRPSGGCVALQQEEAQKRGVGFVSGVDEVVAERMKKLLRDEGYVSSFSEQRVRMGNNSGKRCVVDAQGHETMSEMKDKILRLDLGCVGHQYDGRLEVATEVASTGSSSSRSQKWTMERLKRRTSFVKKECAWQVDLTDVTTIHLEKKSSSGGTEQCMELEVELLPSALQRWLGCRDEGGEAHRVTSRLATELREVFNTCIIQTSEEGAAETGRAGRASAACCPLPVA